MYLFMLINRTNDGKPKRRSDFVLTQDSRFNRHSTSVKTTNKHSVATLTTPRPRKALSTSLAPIKDDNPNKPVNNQDRIPFSPEIEARPQMPFSPEIEARPKIPELKEESTENSGDKGSVLISSFQCNKKKMEMKGSQEIKGNSTDGIIGSYLSPFNMDFRKAPTPTPTAQQDDSFEQYTDISV